MLCLDNETLELLNIWVDEHQNGILNSSTPILVLDMWEHAYLMDYLPGEKMKYVDAFFANVNWLVAENSYTTAIR